MPEIHFATATENGPVIKCAGICAYNYVDRVAYTGNWENVTCKKCLEAKQKISAVATMSGKPGSEQNTINDAETKKIRWTGKAKTGITGNNKDFDYHIRRDYPGEGGVTLDVFEHRIKNPSKAYRESFQLDTIQEAKLDAEAYIRYDFEKQR